jgi:hypothetical protein
VHLLEPRYSTSKPISADTLEELVGLLDIDNRPQAIRTLHEFNRAARDAEDGFDPTKKDGVATRGGERFASRPDDFERRGPAGQPMTGEELWENFADCAKHSMPAENIAPLFDRLGSIEVLGNIADLTRLLERQDTATTRRIAW